MTSEPHIEGEIQRLLAEDEEIAEPGIDVVCVNGHIEMRGAVGSAERRAMIERRVREAYPDCQVHSEITVAGAAAPDGREAAA